MATAMEVILQRASPNRHGTSIAVGVRDAGGEPGLRFDCAGQRASLGGQRVDGAPIKLVGDGDDWIDQGLEVIAFARRLNVEPSGREGARESRHGSPMSAPVIGRPTIARAVRACDATASLNQFGRSTSCDAAASANHSAAPVQSPVATAR